MILKQYFDSKSRWWRTMELEAVNCLIHFISRLPVKLPKFSDEMLAQWLRESNSGEKSIRKLEINLNMNRERETERIIKPSCFCKDWIKTIHLSFEFVQWCCASTRILNVLSLVERTTIFTVNVSAEQKVFHVRKIWRKIGLEQHWMSAYGVTTPFLLLTMTTTKTMLMTLHQKSFLIYLQHELRKTFNIHNHT